MTNTATRIARLLALAPPTLRRDLNLGTTWLLPAWSHGPHGDEQAVLEAAKAAGADIVGMDDLGEAVKKGEMNFDVVIASPDAQAIGASLIFKIGGTI